MHEQLEHDIRKNTRLRGKTPLRHAPQNVYRSQGSPILSRQSQLKHTVGDMNDSFSIQMIKPDEVENTTGQIDMARYGYL